MSEKMPLEKKKCTTPKFRVSFPQVFTPKGFKDQEPKYSVTMLFDKKTDLKPLKEAIEFAAIEKFGANKAKWPKNLRMPIKDGNEKSDLPGYANTWVVTATAKADKKPGVVDRQANRIDSDDGQFYAGCYARATLIAFAYDTAGNKGVSFSLQNLIKWEDGPRFGGKKDAADDFADILDEKDESDDSSNYDSDETSDELSSEDF